MKGTKQMKAPTSSSSAIQTQSPPLPLPGSRAPRPINALLTSWAAAFALLLLGAAAQTARADANWDGDNPIGNFSYTDNFYCNSAGGCGGYGYGGSLHFSLRNNSNQTSQYQDVGWQNEDNIYWDSGWPVDTTFNANGSSGINVNQRIENDSYHTITMNCPTSGAKNGASQIELNPVNGDLVLNANVYNDNNKPFYVYGASSKMLTIGVGLTGNSSVNLTIAQYSKVKLTAAQNWGDSTHGVSIQQGEFWLDSGGSLASSSVPITVGLSDANTAKLWLSVATGGQTLNSPITVNNQSSSPAEKTIGGLNTSGTSTFGGTVTLNGQVNLSAGTGGTVVFGNVISGSSQNVVINGYLLPLAGTIIMSAANTYSGNTYISGGTLQFNSGGTAASSPNFYLGETSGSQTATLALGVTGGGQTLNNPITVRSGSSGTKTISGLATSSSSTLGGNITLSDNLTVSSASGGNLNLGGVISGSGFGVTKVGAGTVTLTSSSANTYTGNTTISAGTLLVNGSTASGSSVTVASATTLGGSGTINGPLSVGSGGIVAPGAGAASAGTTLTLAGTVTLNSGCVVSNRINKTTLTADKVSKSGGTLTLAGTLKVVLDSGTLAKGDSFTLFGGTLAGSFASTSLPTLPTGLAWDTTQLGAGGNGKISVVCDGSLAASAGAAKAVCAGGSTGIGGSLTGSGGSGGYTYSWSPGAGLSSATVANPTATPSSTTTYTVTVTDSGGCTAQSRVIVTVNAIPSAPSTTGGSRCGSGTVGLSASGSGGTLKWYSDAGLTTQVGTGTSYTTPSLSSTTTYYVTETSAAGCVSTSSAVTATVNAIPDQTITPAASAVCAGSTGNTADVATTSGATYSWSIIGGTITAGASSSHVTYTAGTGSAVTLSCVVTSSAGCASAGGQNTSVTVNAIPGQTITPAASAVCADSTGNTADVTTTSGATYSWSITGGTITAGGSSSHVTYTAGTGSAVTLSCVVTPSAGCASAGGQNTSVTVSALPTAPNGTYARAPGGSLKILISSLGASDPISSLGGGSQLATITHDATYIYYLPQTGNANDDSFTYTVANANCSKSGTITVNVVKEGGVAKSITVVDGMVTIVFAGVPHVLYDVERKHYIGDSWTAVSTGPYEAPDAGVWTYVDDPAPWSDSGYYRLKQH
jgi:autotransporter-associated beta strand protein